MKISYQWLKEFVDIRINPSVLAEKLTMAGLEVKGIEKIKDDFVYEIEITSNRADWLSIIGVAREVAAILNKKLIKIEKYSLLTRPKKQLSKYSISIEDKNDCPLYTAQIFENVRVGPSPEWLRKRIEAVGCRSINNVVDITNYVMFELGAPLHAFDRDKLKGDTIFIRRARPQETIISIDGQKHILSTQNLVIADTQGPVALAGIMGGRHTEVDNNTKIVMLEAALFSPVLIRRGRQSLGIQTESSYRFERGLDYQTVLKAAERAAELMIKLCNAKRVGVHTLHLPFPKELKLEVDSSYFCNNLGISLSSSTISQILSRLGFKVSKLTRERLQVSIPSFRRDIKAPIDLVEEVSRIYGYEKIPASLPTVILQSNKDTYTLYHFIRELKSLLRGLGLNEAITYSLVDQQTLEGFWGKEDVLIRVVNPLSKEQQILRPTLLPSLVRSVCYNLRQKQKEVKLFEIAKVFYKDKDQPQEKYYLSFAIAGTKIVWLEPELKHIEDHQGLLHTKGIVDTILSYLGITERVFVAQLDGSWNIEINGYLIGRMLEVNRNFLTKLDVKNQNVYCAELNLEMLFKLHRRHRDYQAFSRFPAITRDISIVVKDSVSVEDILEAIKKEADEVIRNVQVIDYYKGEPIALGYKNITVSCLYSGCDHTLSEDEITPIDARIREKLSKIFGATFR
ncbi:MAG: phenylalanine--tRNA ligase subunit beta [Candidatus Omnitrophica bacterium]|nr:phenylalanine--tRNA ligase subunit beta [Candidatus Omnitrophota bacterium]